MPTCELSLDVLAHVAANLTDYECMMKLSLASKEFYMAVQLRYKYNCIINGYIKGYDLKLQKQISSSSTGGPILRKTLSQQIVDSKNYSSIYGKFSSKK